MSCKPVIVSGDDTDIAVTLKKNDVTFDIPLVSTVTAALISLDKNTQYISTVIVDNAAAGADWSQSLVVVEFTSTQTASIGHGPALLEVQVDDNGKLTWFGSVVRKSDTIT